MEVKAQLKYAKIAVLKVRPSAALIRGKKAFEAESILSVQNKKASALIYKLLRSAVSNAEQKKTIDLDRLYVKKIAVSQGPQRKSFMPRARGRASGIIKKTSHISIVLDEK